MSFIKNKYTRKHKSNTLFYTNFFYYFIIWIIHLFITECTYILVHFTHLHQHFYIKVNQIFLKLTTIKPVFWYCPFFSLPVVKSLENVSEYCQRVAFAPNYNRSFDYLAVSIDKQVHILKLIYVGGKITVQVNMPLECFLLLTIKPI